MPEPLKEELTIEGVLVAFGLNAIEFANDKLADVGNVSIEATAKLLQDTLSGIPIGMVAGSALKWIANKFTDHSNELPKILKKANEQSWTAVGLALGGDSVFTKVKNLWTDADTKAARDNIRSYLDSTPTGLEKLTEQERQLAYDDYYKFIKKKMTVKKIEVAAIARLAPPQNRFTDPVMISQAAVRATLLIAKQIRRDAPHLAKVLELPAPDGGLPLLTASYLFFLREGLKKNSALTTVLTFETVQKVLAIQEQGFARLDEKTFEISDKLYVLAEKIDSGFSDMKTGFSDMKTGFSSVEQKLDQIQKALLAPAMIATPRRPATRDKAAVPEPLIPSEDLLAPGRVRTPGERLKMNLKSGLTMEFAWCPPGVFAMGSDKGVELADFVRKRIYGYDDEQPVHYVTLSKGFFIGVKPVTQEQWQAIKSENPSAFSGAHRPVENVSWEQCTYFCKLLTTRLKGLITIRLPTEAQWEYACRAGSITEYHFGDTITTEMVNYDGRYQWNESPRGSYQAQTSIVGVLPANPWGLFDVHGNVMEWCADWYGSYSAEDQTDPTGPATGDKRVARGGSWHDAPQSCRSAYRRRFEPGHHESTIGCRVCFSLD